MANSDSSSYTLRYNEISTNLEYANGGNWFMVPSHTAGVSALNTLTGAVTLAAGSNITLTPSGNTITIASSSSSGVSSLNTLTGAVVLAAGTNITLTPSGNTITIASTGSAAAVNVVQTVSNSFGSTTSDTFVSTPLAVTITPSSSSAKIMISATFGLQVLSGGVGHATIYRNSTPLDVSGKGFASVQLGNPVGDPVSMLFVDSPSTTSATTYTIYIRNEDSTSMVNLNATGDDAVIIAQEVH